MSGKLIHLLEIGEYKPGDPQPNGYLKWHAWAEAQYNAGLRQVVCPSCCKWKFPKELSDTTRTCIEGMTAKQIASGETAGKTEKKICTECDEKQSNP